VALVRTDVLEDRSASMMKVTRIGELGQLAYLHIIIIIFIIFISINPVQSRMWKSQYKYKISSAEYNVNIVIEASKYIKQSDII
jgi:hypothetical protein